MRLSRTGKCFPHSSRVSLPSVRCRGKSSFSRYHAMAARLPPRVRGSFGKRTGKGVAGLIFPPPSNEKPVHCCHLSNDFFTDFPTLSRRRNIVPFRQRLRFIPAKNSRFSLLSLFVLHFPSLRFLFLFLADGCRKYSATMTLDSRGNAAVQRKTRRRISY